MLSIGDLGKVRGCTVELLIKTSFSVVDDARVQSIHFR